MAAAASILLAPYVGPPGDLPLEAYLRTTYQPDCDFVDGHLEERLMGERDHSILQIAIGAWFYNRRAEWHIVVMSEQRIRVSETRVRLPDLCIFSADAPAEKIPSTPPLIAIELLSPEDRLSRVVARLDEFHVMGVPNIWLLDPADRSAFTYTREGLQLARGTHLEASGTAIYLDLPEVFSALD